MQVDLSTAIAIAAMVFAAGGAWITVRKTAASAKAQGIRIGNLEIELAEMRGAQSVTYEPPRAQQRTKTRAGVPNPIDAEDP